MDILSGEYIRFIKCHGAIAYLAFVQIYLVKGEKSMGKLTEVEIHKAKPKEKVYRLGDGDGLHLEVIPAGGKY